jgi:hypothetical protein
MAHPGSRAPAHPAPLVDLGMWSVAALDKALSTTSATVDPGARIDFLSRQFIGIPYEESTLIGSISVPERLVINLRGVACFTYIDYVEAMRLSDSFDGFREQLRRVRYRRGKVAFLTRRHFFSDWLSSRRVRDVTGMIGAAAALKACKTINKNSDGGPYVPGLAPVERHISYIPLAGLQPEMFAAIRTGDYVGIYSESSGLDVSHVGIAIAGDEKVVLRHASSVERKVMDQDLPTYLQGRPGIVIFRPRALSPLR